jgi:two-component system, chemotaxis family, protein-glutamate methylesterase/glutaminase
MRDVIVVGASAGGIRALSAVLGGLPPELPASILAVVHIPPYSRSALPLLLSNAGPLPAKAAEDGEKLSRGKVYVAPPDRHLLVERGRLRLTRGPRENRVRPCVDTLFRSAAVDLGPRVVGVVLSGALDDGTAGLWAVKDRGGATVVQKPADAEYPDMPQSALANVEVDHVLSAGEIGRCLAALTKEAVPAPAPVPGAMAAEVDMELGANTLKKGIFELGEQSRNTCPECNGALVEIHDGPIVRYRCHTGHAFSTGTLLAETDTEIEKYFWNAVRAIEERSFLLRTMEQRARKAGHGALADRLAADAARDEAHAQGVRRLAVERGQREPAGDDAGTRLRRRLAMAGGRGGQSES